MPGRNGLSDIVYGLSDIFARPKNRDTAKLPGGFDGRVSLLYHLKLFPHILQKSQDISSFLTAALRKKGEPCLYKDGFSRGSTLFENNLFSALILNADLRAGLPYLHPAGSGMHFHSPYR